MRIVIIGVVAVALIWAGMLVHDGYGGKGAPGAMSDDFDGPAGSAPDSKLWTAQTGGGGWGNNEMQDYTAGAAVLDGEGNLVITATIPKDGATPTSGRVSTQGKWSFTYGRLSARILLPEGQGLLPAFWLLGDSISLVGWPGAGEIDVVETPNTTLKSMYHVHGPRSFTEKWSVAEGVAHTTPLSADYHVFTVDRQPGRVILSLDDQVVLDVSENEMPARGVWVFNYPMHALFSLAVGGNWPGPPDETTPEVAQMKIDWVRFTPYED